MTGFWGKVVDRRRRFLNRFLVPGYASLLILTAAVSLYIAPTGAAQAPKPAPKSDSVPAGNAQSGKQDFANDNCGTCHGNEGQGSEGAGPRIGPPGRSFPDFVQYVRKPTGDMPPVTIRRVPDSDLADIYAFLRSVSPAPQASPAPAGNVQDGKQAFGSNCSMCHGSEGQGNEGGGPRIGPPGHSFADFVQFVRQPKGDMPPVTVRRVPDASLADIYAFLQTIAAPSPGKGDTNP